MIWICTKWIIFLLLWKDKSLKSVKLPSTSRAHSFWHFRYLPCNIIPPTSSYDTNSRAPSNRPCYLAVGRTQLILLELAKGSLKEGTCICSFFLNEIIEAEIEEGRRILMIKVCCFVRTLFSTRFVHPSSSPPLLISIQILIFIIARIFPFMFSNFSLQEQICVSVHRNWFPLLEIQISIKRLKRYALLSSFSDPCRSTSSLKTALESLWTKMLISLLMLVSSFC